MCGLWSKFSFSPDTEVRFVIELHTPAMVSWVAYVDEKARESKMADDEPKISAIGIYRLPKEISHPTRDEDDVDDDVFTDKCALTLEPLSECEELGILLFSEADKGSAHEWRLTCAPSIRFNEATPPHDALRSPTIHRFDLSMLKAYVQHHGALNTLCPLCKRGVKVKKNVDEHEIDSMAQLKEKRDAQKSSNDLQMCYYTESLMIRKACEDKPQRVGDHAKFVKDVLSHWSQRAVIDNYKRNLYESLQYALKKDHSPVVREMLTCVFNDDKEKLQEMLVLACASGAMDSIKLLVEEHHAPIDREGAALLEAVKYQNHFLIEYLLIAMKKRTIHEEEERKEAYIVREVFRKVIQFDMVDVARTIIEARFYSPTPDDVEYATSLEGNVGQYLESRTRAVKSSSPDEDELDLDDWGGDEDDGGDFGAMEDEGDWS